MVKPTFQEEFQKRFPHLNEENLPFEVSQEEEGWIVNFLGQMLRVESPAKICDLYFELFLDGIGQDHDRASGKDL